MLILSPPPHTHARVIFNINEPQILKNVLIDEKLLLEKHYEVLILRR